MRGTLWKLRKLMVFKWNFKKEIDHLGNHVFLKLTKNLAWTNTARLGLWLQSHKSVTAKPQVCEQSHKPVTAKSQKGWCQCNKAINRLNSYDCSLCWARRTLYGGMGSNHVFNYSADTEVPNAFFSQSLAQYKTNSSQDAFQGKALAGSIGKPLQYALSLLAQDLDVLAWGSLRIRLPAALIFSLRARITRNHSSGRLKLTGWTRLANEGHAFVAFVILQSVLGECNQSTRPPVGAVVPDGHACLGSINLLSFAKVRKGFERAQHQISHQKFENMYQYFYIWITSSTSDLDIHNDAKRSLRILESTLDILTLVDCYPLKDHQTTVVNRESIDPKLTVYDSAGAVSATAEKVLTQGYKFTLIFLEWAPIGLKID